MEAPVFVKIGQYKELSAILKKLQDSLEAADKTISQLTQVKEEEDRRISEWQDNLQMIQGKLDSINDNMHQR